MSPDLLSALINSGLLGYTTDHGVPLAGVEHFEQYGAQWRPELGERHTGVESYQNLPHPTDIRGGAQPVGTVTQVRIAASNNLHRADTDLGWIAQFYIRPNRFYFPDPAALALVNAPTLKLAHKREVLGTRWPTVLYPDPEGAVAMLMVRCPRFVGNHPLEAAYDVAAPVLDQLSFEYDQPLPVAQSLVVGVPSGVLTVQTHKPAPVRVIQATDSVLASPLHPELADAIALYREAISSNNPFHQFLTLWKVYENACTVRGNWRKHVHGRRGDSRSDVRVREEVFPDVFVFAHLTGQSFDLARKEMTDLFRNAIAHGSLDDDTPPRTGASSVHFFQVAAKIPVLRYMARTILENVVATLSSTASPQSASGVVDDAP